MISLAALLRKEFSAPTTATGGLQPYSLEGQVKHTYPESRAALLKPRKKQLTSLIPLLSKGDLPGHPFRGNQWTDGEASVKTARDSENVRYALALRIEEQQAEDEGLSLVHVEAYNMMGAALGDIGTKASYSEHDGKIVAAISYNVRPDDVHVNFFGSIKAGEGSRLLEAVEKEALNRSLPVTLNAVEGAISFYRSRGYVAMKGKKHADLSMILRPKMKKADAAPVSDVGPLARGPKAVKWRRKDREAQKLTYAHPETCSCHGAIGRSAVLKAAPESRIRDYVLNRLNPVQSMVHEILQRWGKKWAAELSKALPEASKADLGLLIKASTKTVREILDDIDMDGFSVALMDGVSPAMKKAFKDGGLDARAMVGLENDAKDMLALMDEDALDFARARAAELVGKKMVDGKLVDNPNAKWSVPDTTRDGLRSIVSEGITSGWGTQELQERILDSFFFSDKRAEMIARTELAFAHVQGNLKGWKDTGVVAGKRWILADTHPYEDVCDENEAEGIVPLDEPFGDGSMGPPAHPLCLCDIVPVLDDEMPKATKGDLPGHPFRGNQYQAAEAKADHLGGDLGIIRTSDLFPGSGLASPEEVQRVSDASKALSADQGKKTAVTLKNLIPLEGMVDAERVKFYLPNALKQTEPVVVQSGGKSFLIDGHHRVAAALLRGDTHIVGHVTLLDAASPRKTKKTDLGLLRKA